MICPHCLKTIDDESVFCPYCNGFVESAPSAAARPVFCEGCGARLAPGDRVCPKCGRPAPAILSSDSSADDLAAGRTASFPAITGDGSYAQQRPVDASLDPDLTNSLSTADVRAAMEPLDDPYHPRRSARGKVLAALAAVLVVAGAAALLWFDPFGVMPSIEGSFREAASEAFPSKEGDVPESQVAGEGEPQDPDAPLSDADAYARLDAAYAKLVGYHDSFGNVIDDFNGYYAALDRDLREDSSASAYGMRDGIDAVIDDLEGLSLEEGSPRAEEAERLVALAKQLRVRPQALCDCWDVSLGYEAGEQPSGDDVLAPLRDSYADDSWYESWDAFEEGISGAEPAKPDESADEAA